LVGGTKSWHVIPSEARDLLFMKERLYYVYILASRSRNLYTGITNHLVRRVQEHREGIVGSFAGRYRIHRVVHFEMFHDVRAAIAREKEIKGWRARKRCF
jgi:putative endonuclease